MGFTYPPIINDSQLYNPLFYPSLSADGYLTYDFAQTLYLSKNDYRLSYLSGVVVGQATAGSAIVLGNDLSLSGIGALACTSLTVGGSAVSSPPAYVLSITEGLAAASKALVLDGSRNITNINALTATALNGTIGTAAQPNITSLGTLTGLTISGNLTFSGASRTITGLGTLTATTLNGMIGTAAQTSITSLGTLTGLTINGNLTFSGASRTITGLDTLTATTLNGTIGTASQTNITSLGTLTGLSINGSLTFGGIGATAIIGLTQIDCTFYKQNGTLYDISLTGLLNTTAGIAAPSKALILDSSSDIVGIDSLAATTLRSSVSTPGRILTNTSPVIDYNIIVANSSNIDTCTSSIAFLTNTDADFANMTPSAAIVASRAGTATYAGCRIDFISKKSTYETSKLGMVQRRMSIHGDNLISFGTKDGDKDLNMLSGGLDAAFRFGSALSAKNCYTMQFSYAGPSSDSNYLSFDVYGTSGCLTMFANNNIVIGSTSSKTSKFCVIGSGTNLYGSWKRTMRLENDNATRMAYEVLIYNENGGANTNGVAVGTMTNDPLNWMINGSTCMLLNTSRRLAVDRTAPEACIHSGGQIWCDDAGFHCKQNVDGKAVYRTNWSQANYLAMGTDATVGAMRLGVCNASFDWVSYVPVRGGAYTNASDERLKKDIVELPYGLDSVLAMKPRRFTMRDSGKQCIGFVAQEMLPIVPEVVAGIESPDDELNEYGLPINPMGVDLSSLVSVLCKAIQELKAEVDEQRLEIIDILNRLSGA